MISFDMTTGPVIYRLASMIALMMKTATGGRKVKRTEM